MSAQASVATAERKSRRPLIAPLQRPLLGRLLQIVGAVMLLWLGIFLGLNDRRLGRLITWVVTHNVRGQFNLGYAHYDYWSGLASAILDIPVPVRGGDFELIDPDGDVVLRVHEIRANMYIGELVRGLLRTAVSAPLKRGSFIHLHFSRAEIRGGFARVQPLPSSLRRDPQHPEMNIVATMNGRKPSPPGDQPGRVRIIVDGEGAELSDLTFQMRFPLWQVHLTGLSGAATLRFSSASSETRPGRPSFTYEIAPLSATGGTLTITPSGRNGQLAPEPLPPPALPELVNLVEPAGQALGRPDRPALADSIIGGPRYELPISEVSLRRFGARPSRMQDLSFRGRARVGGALLELDGRLLDTYCDVGADIELSFEEAGAVLAQLTGGALFGRPRGRGRVFGPFSEDLPKTAENLPHSCLSVIGRESPYVPLGQPPSPEARLLVIDGNLANLEADLAKIHVTEGQAPFRLVRNVLTLPTLAASALGGTVRSEGFYVDFNAPMRYGGTMNVNGADPALAQLVPPWLRPLLAGSAGGSFRLFGVLADPKAIPEVRPPLRVDPNEGDRRGEAEALAMLRRGESVRLSAIDVELQRRPRAVDPLPPRMTLNSEQVTVGPEQLSLRDLKVLGPGGELVVPGGTLALPAGHVSLPGIRLSGGGEATRALRALGARANVRDLAMGFDLRGTLDRPEVEQGFVQVRGLDLRPSDASTGAPGAPPGAAGPAAAGERRAVGLDEVVTGFTIHDGAVALQGLDAHGSLGRLAGRGSLQIFVGDVARRPTDPVLTLRADAERVDLAGLLGLLGVTVPATGLLTGRADLSGTLLRPTGTLNAQVPQLGLYGGQLSDINVDVDLLSHRFDLTTLYAVLGRAGVLRGNAAIGRDGAMPLDMNLLPERLQLDELPGVGALPFGLKGALSGTLRVTGEGRPLMPVLEGNLNLDGFMVSGRARPSAQPVANLERRGVALPETRRADDRARAALPAPAFPLREDADVEPLFRLLGVAVRTLSLGKAALSFRPLPGPGGATLVRGTLFNAFTVDGQVTLDAADPRGELRVAFGCPEAADARAACDLPVEDLLPELKVLGSVEASARVSGELRLRFGRDLGPRRLQPGPALAAGAVPLPYLATLRLWRAQLNLKTADEEGVAQWYRLRNSDDVIVASDGETLQVQQALFRSEREVARRRETLGELAIRGRLSPQDSALDLVGKLRLELFEELLRGTFEQARGDLQLDLRLLGPRDNLQVSGLLEVKGASLRPQDLDTAFQVPAGRFAFTPGQVQIRGLQMSADGATASVDGQVVLARALPPQVERFDLTLRGGVGGLALQWLLPRTLSEARGLLKLGDVRLRGTPDDPRLDGTVTAQDLRLSVRRFHELLLRRGTLRFQSASAGTGATVIVGCGSEATQLTGCQAVEGLVDGDGRFRVTGTVRHRGLGALLRPGWPAALQRVDLALSMDNVRHNGSGVYTVEVKTQGPLALTGDGRQLVLAGRLDVVEGRYLQPFDLKERILARRVVEEEEPFWKGDELLSRLQLDLLVSTNGLFRVLNNIADLRLSTKAFVISGPLDSLSMKGAIRVDGGFFTVPGLRGEFNVKGDSKIEFDPGARWPETPFVDVRGSNVQFDPTEQQRNVELALRGKVSELKIECLSSDGLNAADCATYLVLGGTTEQLRRNLSAPTYTSSPQALAYSDRMVSLLTSQLLTSQIEDPLRSVLRLDTVRIQFGVSSFDVQLCKRFGLYLRACGLAEWGLLAATAARYRAFGQFQIADWVAGELSVDRLERGFDRVIQDPINRLKIQLGARLPLLY